MNPDAFGLFQIASPMRSDMPEFGPDRINIMASPHMPPGRAYMVGMDPADEDAPVTVMVDEASQVLGTPGTGKTRHLPKPDWAELARVGRKTDISTDWVNQRFPSLKRFVEQYSKFVPQDNNPTKEYTMDMAGLARMRADLEGMLSKFTSMVAIVERFGGEPGDGSVIKFEHTFDADFVRNEDAKVYDYVAVRKFGKWYVSGRPFSGQAVAWARLLEFIGDGRAWICSEFTEVPLPGASAEADANVGDVAQLLADLDGKSNQDIAAEILKLVNKSK